MGLILLNIAVPMEDLNSAPNTSPRHRRQNAPPMPVVNAQINLSHQSAQDVLAPLNLRTEQEMADFIAGLPNQIEGSQKVYSFGEISALISAVLTGATPTDRLTSSQNIHEVVEQYMQNRIDAAAKKFPGVLKENVNWYNRQPITNFQQRFVFADQWLRLSELSPATLQKLNGGYATLAPADRGQFLREIAGLHQGAMEYKGQDHLYFENPDFQLTRAQVKARAESIKTNLNIVGEFANEYQQALQNGRQRAARAVQQAAVEYLDRNIDNLGTEYKIHLHTAAHFTPQMIDRLFMAIKFDPYLRNNISNLKVARTSNEQANAELPESEQEFIADVVVYPRRGGTVQESAYMTNVLIARLQKHFADYDTAEADAQEIPRYNLKLSHVLFLAQSGGDLKNNLRELGLLDRYFDRSKQYAVMR